MKRRLCILGFGLAVLAGGPAAKAQQLDVEQIFEERNLGPVGRLLVDGEYDLCARICEQAITRTMKAVEWRLYRLKAMQALGQVATALKESEGMIKTYPDDLRLLMLRYDLAHELRQTAVADAVLAQVNEVARKKPAAERTAAEWVALGQAALAYGADAKKVISGYFQQAQKKDAKAEEPYLAEGFLALEKSDPARAADVFRAGLKNHGETPDLRYGLARAYFNGDREKAGENLTRVIEVNPRHQEAQLARAEMMIASERFMDAEGVIQQVLDVDDTSPKAWALRAAIAVLANADEKAMQDARAKGLQRVAKNAEVDHTIGRIMSRAYRFAEGAAHQRAALEMDPSHLRARLQLSNDLLRLGEEAEAWQLASAVREEDGYNVQAHNLGLLEKEMGGYTEKKFDDFTLKMPSREWPIYGDRALSLLREARSVLMARYGVELKRPVLVEFFPHQQDFAIRTFGSLGGQGLLGVCFGTVITMNSPGGLAQGRNNWESTLWHEFCHVVTLSATKNRMPRWLSEGISVHEEAQRNPAWGMKMNTTFRDMILDEEGGPTPVGQLSSAFTTAETNDDLMFAYFESAQVVGYVIDKYGEEKFKAVLRDLAAGKRINDALSQNTAPIEELEADFALALKKQAEAYGAAADWKRPDAEEVNASDKDSVADFLKKNPNNLWAIHRQLDDCLKNEQWEEGLKWADRLIQLVPEDTSGDSGYMLNAQLLRELKRDKEEIAVLRDLAARAPDAMDVFTRLLEVDTVAKNWADVRINAQRVLAINPFLRTAQQSLAEADEAEGNAADAIQSYERVLLLDPPNPTQVHYRLANLIRATDQPRAKRHLLEALLLSPRFKDGLSLLEELATPQR